MEPQARLHPSAEDLPSCPTSSASLGKTSALPTQDASPIPPVRHRGPPAWAKPGLFGAPILCLQGSHRTPTSCAVTPALVCPLRISGYLLYVISFSLASHLPFSTLPALNVVTGHLCFQISQSFRSGWKVSCQTEAIDAFRTPGPSFHGRVPGVMNQDPADTSSSFMMSTETASLHLSLPKEEKMRVPLGPQDLHFFFF